jgi:hypothetical protein
LSLPEGFFAAGVLVAGGGAADFVSVDGFDSAAGFASEPAVSDLGGVDSVGALEPSERAV